MKIVVSPIFMGSTSICVLSCLHDDYWFTARALASCETAGTILAFVNQKAWNGEPGDWQKCADAAGSVGAEVILGEWQDETEHRRFAMAEAKKRGYTHAIIPDGDEVLEPKLLQSLVEIAQAGIAERVYAHMDTYWKSARYVIRPREQLTPVILIDLDQVEHAHIRDYRGGRQLVLGPEYGIIHHLSYAGPDERIERKLETWSHRHEVQSDWYRRVWRGWDHDKLMHNLHPTHPTAYGYAERIQIPEVLQGVWDEREIAMNPEPIANWPKVSIVIPLHGGEEDIRGCLASLEASQDLLHEVIVVDDVSPDGAGAVAKSFETAIFLENETNLGFAGTCNKGYARSTGDVVVFLNSDTVVPRAGLIRLIESLWSSGSVGAAGPYSNKAGYEQGIENATYEDVRNLGGFARDFASRIADDREVGLLVGFCLAVRRSVLKEVGAFDERFGKGLFEDNDLCYRIQRAGYSVRIAARSFVHHWGSRSLARIGLPSEVLLARNEAIYHAKWRGELESGFASHLPGQSPDPVTFRKELHPDAILSRAKQLSHKADISLCMIVKDEERVLGDCLASAMPFFSQVAVVDTGSKDRTIEIARSHGAQVIESSWNDSFSAARNESLQHANGKWIFWMDADDTLPAASAEAILRASIQAPKEVVGFIVPVQFVEEGPGAGTRVDHVKLFRNFPGLHFVGRIHEQILHSLRQHGEIARIEGALVLHSGYDNTEEGQAKKRLRDEKLLKLDLDEQPGHPFPMFNMGMTAHYCRDHLVAIEWLTRCIAASGENDSHVRKAYSLKGASYRFLENYDEALATFAEGLSKVGPDPELLFQTGVALSEQGRLAEAKNAYLSMPLDTSGFFTSIDIGILGYKRSASIGRVCLAMGDYIEGRDWLLKAFEQNPRAQEIPIELVRFSLERGDFRTAQATLELMRKYCGPTYDWANLQAQFMDLRGESPENFLWQVAMMHPCAVGPRLVLARRLLNSGYEREAARHLEILDGLGCAEAAFFRGICCVRNADYAGALNHMERAHELDPGHLETIRQIENLKQALVGS